MTATQSTPDRVTRPNGLIVILVSIAMLTAGCGGTPQPSSPTIPLITPEPTSKPATVLSQTATPDPCTGWWCTLSGTVYGGSASAGQQLANATVTLNHISYCSPTAGQYTVTTQTDGKFAFQVYLHDTDSFVFRAGKSGVPPVEKKFGGFDCLYCGCQPLELVIPSSSANQTLPQLSEAAEAWRLLDTYGDQVWPGWGTARIPLLIRAGEFDLLVGHPSPPEGFTQWPDATVADQPIYRYKGHLVPVPAATAWEVGEVWSVAVPTREEFQPAIDAQLGKGIVTLDTVNYIRAIVHEAFHAYAMTVIQGDVPTFGSDVDEGEMIQQLAALPDLDKQYAVEGQALVNALQATDQQGTRDAAARFLKLRQSRRTAQDQKIAAYEKTTEWVEGLARYAEVALMLRASQITANNTITYPATAEIWQPFLDQLMHPTASPDGFRGRYYLLGAGQAFLLDRLLPDWKSRVLTEKVSLEDLLQEAVK